MPAAFTYKYTENLLTLQRIIKISRSIVYIRRITYSQKKAIANENNYISQFVTIRGRTFVLCNSFCQQQQWHSRRREAYKVC